MAKKYSDKSLKNGVRWVCLRSLIVSKIGFNDQKFCADSKDIYINIIPVIWCHRTASNVIRCHIMTSGVRKYIYIYVSDCLSLFWTKYIFSSKCPPLDFDHFEWIVQSFFGQDRGFIESQRILVFFTLQFFLTILLHSYF